MPGSGPVLLRHQQLGPELEVHGIEVIPLAAPDEAMFFEDRDNLLRHAVAINDRAVMRAPVPIIRECGVKIDSDTVAVRARLSGVRYGSAGISARDWGGGAFDFCRARVDLRRHLAQLRSDAVERRDAD